MSSIRPLEKDDLTGHVRRLRFDGKPLRLRYSEWFATDPAVRGRGMGALLLRSCLAGPQDLTITWWMGHLVEPFTSKALSPR
jgi:hypothetical protein